MNNTISLSDASVEAAVAAAKEHMGIRGSVRAAITAYLEAEKQAGRAREASCYEYGSTWVADSTRPSRPSTPDFPALIISLEPSK